MLIQQMPEYVKFLTKQAKSGHIYEVEPSQVPPILRAWNDI